MLNKYTKFAMAAVLALSLTACGDDEDSNGILPGGECEALPDLGAVVPCDSDAGFYTRYIISQREGGTVTEQTCNVEDAVVPAEQEDFDAEFAQSNATETRVSNDDYTRADACATGSLQVTEDLSDETYRRLIIWRRN